MSQCTWDGTLSLQDFHFAAEAFAERWKDINPTLPQWTWISKPMSLISSSCEGEGYLSLEGICLPKSSEDLDTSKCCIGTEDESIDCATLALFDNQETHLFDYHVLYNFSFRVPVLYFRGYQYDGQPLGSDEIDRDLPSHSASILKEFKWTYMTKEDHPFLRRPWYMLHPCGTSDWMKLLISGSQAIDSDVGRRYLSSWFSVIGPAVGLRIPLEMQTTLHPRLH